MAQQLHLTEGEVLSLMMKEFILKFQDEEFPDLSSTTLLSGNRNIPVITVAHHDNLRITENNLQNINTKISFKQIKVLEFADVNPKTFMQKIEIIQNCDLVKVPASFPRLLPYTKCYDCEMIGFSKSLDEPCIEYAKEANALVENWKNTEEPV